jgi:hypothetical protein
VYHPRTYEYTFREGCEFCKVFQSCSTKVFGPWRKQTNKQTHKLFFHTALLAVEGTKNFHSFLSRIHFCHQTLNRHTRICTITITLTIFITTTVFVSLSQQHNYLLIYPPGENSWSECFDCIITAERFFQERIPNCGSSWSFPSISVLPFSSSPRRYHEQVGTSDAPSRANSRRLHLKCTIQISSDMFSSLWNELFRAARIDSGRALNSLSPFIFSCPLACPYGRKCLSAMKTMSVDKCQKFVVRPSSSHMLITERLKRHPITDSSSAPNSPSECSFSRTKEQIYGNDI